jgi:phage-related minor tail protein
VDTQAPTPAEREAARIVARALRQDAAAQDAGDFDAIAKRYDDVYGEVLPLCSKLPDPIATAFTFWDWWADARNHDWQYYEGIARDDWPRLARHIAHTVEAGVPISDPALRRHFQRVARPGPIARLKRLLRVRRGSA